MILLLYTRRTVLLASILHIALAFAQCRPACIYALGLPVRRFAALKKELLQKSSAMAEAALDF